MAWSCHYATGCFVAFLGDISILKSDWNVKKLFCCPALDLFRIVYSCGKQWGYLEKSYKMQQSNGFFFFLNQTCSLDCDWTNMCKPIWKRPKIGKKTNISSKGNFKLNLEFWVGSLLSSTYFSRSVQTSSSKIKRCF